MADKHTYFDWVYEVTKSIPAGRVTSYGAIADYLALGSARMVGWALNQAHSQPDVPAHRVVNHRGELTGRNHFTPPSRMQELLEREGIVVENNRIKEFEAHLWIPSVHLADLDIDLGAD